MAVAACVGLSVVVVGPVVGCGTARTGDAASVAATVPAAGAEVAATSSPDGSSTAAPDGGAADAGTFVVHGAGALSQLTPFGWRVLVVVPDGQVESFTGRPFRGPHEEPLLDVVNGWAGRGFTERAPAASLTGTAVDGTPVSLAVEVADPAWNGADNTLLVTIRGVGTDRDTPLPAAFTTFTLTVDDARPTVEVDISNPTDVALRTTTADPAPQVWVAGDRHDLNAPIGAASAAGADLALFATDPTPGVPATTRLALVGDHDNLWTVTVSWSADGTPTASVTQYAGQGIRLVDVPITPMGTAAPLPTFGSPDGAAPDGNIGSGRYLLRFQDA